MRYKDKAVLTYLRFALAVALLSLLTGLVLEETVLSNTRQHAASRAKEPQPGVPAIEYRQSKKPVTPGKKPDAKEQKTSSKPKSLKDPNEEAANSAQEKEHLARSLVEGVLVGTHKSKPAEYGILAQVEAATLLWQFDRERTLSILKSSLEAVQALIDAENADKEAAKRLSRKQRKLRFKVFLRIARLSPDLVIQLASKNSGEDKSKESISGEETEEARALMLVAAEQIDKDPELAVRLAEQSLSVGLAGWQHFLHALVMRDSSRAEQLATNVISRLRDNSIRAGSLFNFNSFALGPDRSEQLEEFFFLSLAARLRRDIRPDAPVIEIEYYLQTARMSQRLAGGSPRWHAEFGEIISVLEEAFTARSLPLPAQPRIMAIDTSSMQSATPGSTLGIEEKAQRVEVVKASQVRDREYQRLAISAALKADGRLAEEFLSKIENEEARRKTTLKVYGPLVRKALGESDWAQAQKYAFKIADPLGRTLVLDRVAGTMSQAGADKQLVKDVYSAAASQLHRDRATEDVVKAFLLLARSLSGRDADEGHEAVNSAIYVINKLTRGGVMPGESEAGYEFSSWISLPSTLSPDDVLDLTEMIGPLFKEIAKRDADDAQSLAFGISHHGLHSLAQLAIASCLLEESGRLKAPRKLTTKTK
jgi:hypothetical protein